MSDRKGRRGGGHRVEGRHEEIYGDPRLPRSATWGLAPRSRAGRNPLSERDVEDLAEAGVTHVLDLREEAEWEGPAGTEERPWRPWRQEGSSASTSRSGTSHP